MADRLGDDGPKHVLIVVGGALLAMHDLRDTTRDIDSISPLEQELREAIAQVAERHGLRIDWLNDRARGFTPATFRVGITPGQCRSGPTTEHDGRFRSTRGPASVSGSMHCGRRGSVPSRTSPRSSVWIATTSSTSVPTVG